MRAPDSGQSAVPFDPERELVGLTVTLDGERVEEVVVQGIAENRGNDTVGGLRTQGTVQVRWSAADGQELASGWTDDPRAVWFEEADPTTGELSGEWAVSDRASVFLLLPAPPEGRGMLELSLPASNGGAGFVAQTEVVVPPPSASTAGATAAPLLEEPEYVAGRREPVQGESTLIVLLPVGFTDLSERHAFLAAVQSQWRALFENDTVFGALRDRISVYAVWSETAASQPGENFCHRTPEATARGTLVTSTAMWDTVDRSYGGIRRTPLATGLVYAPAGCQPFVAAGRWFAVSWVDQWQVLAHEMGHVFGLGDEYPARVCVTADQGRNAQRVNGSDEFVWDCLRPGRPYAASCPDGSPLDYDVATEDCARPCPVCRMGNDYLTASFCPVCEARVRASVTYHASRPAPVSATESCDGADDDYDNAIDEGCDCAPRCSTLGNTCADESECRPADEPACDRVRCREIAIDDLRCCLRPPDRGCSEDEHCCGLTTCVEGACTCRATSESCLSASDCCGGALCIDGRCEGR